jgi:organic radical activating enzyme
MTTTSSSTPEGRPAKIGKRIDELARYRPDSVTPPFPRVVLIELSNLCNHACVFCAYPKMTRPASRMDIDMLERLLHEAYDLGAREVGFYSGAEPFTSRDLEEAILRAKRIGYEYVFISTNGSLASESRMQACIDNGLDSIKFSINGADRDTYRQIHGQDHFDRVLANVRFACEYRRRSGRRIYIAVSCVVIDLPQCSNADAPEWLRAQLGSLVDELVFIPATNENGQMMGLAPMTIDVPCVLPFARAHISAEGYLRACCNDYQNYLALVDLHEHSLAEAWHARVFQQVRQRHLDGRLESTLCHNCVHGVSGPIQPIVPALATPVEERFFDFNPDIIPLKVVSSR